MALRELPRTLEPVMKDCLVVWRDQDGFVECRRHGGWLLQIGAVSLYHCWQQTVPPLALLLACKAPIITRMVSAWVDLVAVGSVIRPRLVA